MTKAKPYLISFTGVDEQTNIFKMISLARQYPIEFAVLKGNTQSPRYPSDDFIEFLGGLCFKFGVKISVHLCGEYAREAQREGFSKYWNFYRIQVNLRDKDYNYDALEQFQSKLRPEIIVQMRSLDTLQRYSGHCLYDVSGGRGISSDLPEYTGDRYVGYAGGISEDNVLEKINQIQSDTYWIDMESSLRTNDLFDLNKVENICKLVYGEPSR